MTIPDPKLYRPCAGVMLVNAAGFAFVGRRIDIKEGDWWQMPQGGIDKGEDVNNAALRELWEETGLLEDKVRIEARMADELYYDLPDDLKGKLWKGRYVGQRQTWFLARLTGSDADIDLAAHNPPEFSAWKWVDPEILPDLIIPFKRSIYSAVLEEFRPLI
ncbi:MAG: RNA pyrophosphohydrolase [Novosphingobium sp.]|nr:RNA pyrophosphohydrolase [Novosphingobium sp.]